MLGGKHQILRKTLDFEESTREVIEIVNWVKTTGEPFLAQTWETFLSGIIFDSMGGGDILG